MTIFEVKQLIAERLGFSMENVRYFYCGQEIMHFHSSKTLIEYGIEHYSLIKIVYNLIGDIGVFDSHHLESIGREWLMQTVTDASKEEVNAIIEGLGASKTAQVQVFTTPLKGLKCE
jgi:hypothetical protein